jgi:gas vesicle protein
MNITKKIATAAAAGFAVGTIAGVLFAPDKGKTTRKKIEDKGKKMASELKSTFEKGKEKLTSLKGENKNATIDIIEPLS